VNDDGAQLTSVNEAVVGIVEGNGRPSA